MYLLRLDHALQAVYAVQRRSGSQRLRASVLAEAIDAVRELDAAHLRRVSAVRGEFYQRLQPHDRPVIAGHRAEVAGLLADAAAVVVAGGHVGVLADALHLFNIAASLRSPVIAWSAGAMALTDRIVLFNDRAPQGPGHPEVYGSGLSVLRNVVAAAARQREAAARRRAPDGRLRPQVRPGPLCPAGEGHPGRHRWRGRPSAGHPGARRRRPRDHPGGSLTTISRPAPAGRKLAINRLRERGPVEPAAVDRFLARHEVPIVEGARCTFLYRGEASEVHLVHQIFGLPRRIPLRRLRGTDLWYVVLELPDGSRVEYQLEVARGEQRERINDPLNPHVAHSPLGSSSVCYARGHEVPEWTQPDPESRPGSLAELVVPSRALRRSCRVTLYLPARFRRIARYPLLIVHDGGDYLKYAAAQTVLDNLIHRLDVAETIVAFVYPGDRLAEYANSAAHARYLTAELVPQLEAEFPLAGVPSARCLMGASFGAVAALSTAYRYPGVYGSLLLQSGSFVFTDIGNDHGGGPGVRAGGAVRQPLPRRPPVGRGPGVRQLRGLRAADRPEPVHGAHVRGRRDGRPLRRGPRRAQLGELARPAAGGAVMDIPRSTEVLL